MESNLQWQQRTDVAIQDFQTQLSQLTSTWSQLQAHESAKLFSHTVLTLEENMLDGRSHELGEGIDDNQFIWSSSMRDLR